MHSKHGKPLSPEASIGGARQAVKGKSRPLDGEQEPHPNLRCYIPPLHYAFEDLTRATPRSTMIVAVATDQSSRSPRMSHPRTTAMTGLM